MASALARGSKPNGGPVMSDLDMLVVCQFCNQVLKLRESTKHTFTCRKPQIDYRCDRCRGDLGPCQSCWREMLFDATGPCQ